MTRICQVPWARMDDVRAQHDVLSGTLTCAPTPAVADPLTRWGCGRVANRCFCA